MRFELISLLAATPSAMASISALSYNPPADFLEKAQSQGCTLPPDFYIKQFSALSNSTGPTAPLSAYNFTYVDPATKITTFCQFNSSSVSTTPPGLTLRYACNNRDVKFIWANDQRQITLLERVCPGSNNLPTYEVSGSLSLLLSCSTTGACAVNSTNYDVKFTSINPVTDPTLLVKYWVD